MDQRHPAPRASDRDREAVVERLRDAAADGRLDMAEFHERMTLAYAARTQPELAPLLADLPDEAGLPTTQASPGTPAVTRIGGALSSTQRRGIWPVPRRLEVSLAMGSLDLDLTETQIPALVEIHLGVVLSSVNVIVPTSVQVDTDSVRNLLSSISHRVRATHPPTATIRLSGHATLSSVTVKTPNPIGQWWRTVTSGG